MSIIQEARIVADLEMQLYTAAAAKVNEYIASLNAKLAQAEQENARLREALTPSADTKAAYIGEFTFMEEVRSHDEDQSGESYVMVKRYVPWDTTKDIMKAIRQRAGIEGGE